MSDNDQHLQTVAEILLNAQQLVVSTGAGISKESGIPTFRDAHDGLWAQYDPQDLATPRAFIKDPKLVWDWYEYRRDLMKNAQPNAGHHALVQMEEYLPNMVIVTQNIDGFHHLAGSSDIICLHGSIHRNKCFGDCQGHPTYIDINTLAWDKSSGPPLCPYCQKAYVRPDVVWFEESLDSALINRAYAVSAQADVMLVVGTSGVVFPAAQLPIITRQNGGIIIEINPNLTQVLALAHRRLEGPSGEILPRILDHMRKLKQA